MAYTREKPYTTPPAEELRRAIPGWGVDLDPADRPSYPKERMERTGAHWDFPERQPELTPREKSTEHKFLTPVFGTAQPLRGISGMIRRYAYTFSEGRAIHWLLLMLGDRADFIESRLEGIGHGRLDNPLTESGVLSELKNGAFRTRFGQHRADLKQQPIDLALAMAPLLLLGGSVFLIARTVKARR